MNSEAGHSQLTICIHFNTLEIPLQINKPRHTLVHEPIIAHFAFKSKSYNKISLTARFHTKEHPGKASKRPTATGIAPNTGSVFRADRSDVEKGNRWSPIPFFNNRSSQSAFKSVPRPSAALIRYVPDHGSDCPVRAIQVCGVLGRRYFTAPSSTA